MTQTAPLVRQPDTVLLARNWDQITQSAAEGAPLSGYGDGTFRGAMDVLDLDGVACITPKAGLTKRYGTVVWPQTCVLDPQQGARFEVLWAEATAWRDVGGVMPGIFGLGHTSSQKAYRNFDLRCYLSRGRVECQVSHRQGPGAALSTVFAYSPPVDVPADTLARIVVIVTPSGTVSVGVDGQFGSPAEVPHWERVKGTQGHHFAVYVGGKDPVDYRMGWKCGGFAVSTWGGGNPVVTVDFDTTPWRTKPRLGRLHEVGGGGERAYPELPILRTDKFAAGAPTVPGAPTASHPYQGKSGRFSYNPAAVVDWFWDQVAGGVDEIMIGLGATPQILGGEHAPKAPGAAWSPVGYPYSAAVPTDPDAYADLWGDWWWLLAVEEGLPIGWVDFWNEPNLVNAKGGVFWAGTRAQLIDLQGRAFRRILALWEEASQRMTAPPARPRFVWWSDAGWNPHYVGNRDNAAWCADLIAYLKANPGTPCDAIGLHTYEGSDACEAGWSTFFVESFLAAGLGAPEVLVTETLPTSSQVSSDPARNAPPFSSIPDYHSGSFAASQLFHQLVFRARAGFGMSVYAGQRSDQRHAGCWFEGGLPRADLNVARLWHLLGEDLYPAHVMGSSSIDAVAGKGADGRGVVVVGRSVWAPQSDVVSVDVDLGPDRAGTWWSAARVSRTAANAREAGADNAYLVWGEPIPADADGVLGVSLGPTDVVGLREVDAPAPDPTPLVYTLRGTLTAPDGTVLTIGPVEVPVTAGGSRA